MTRGKWDAHVVIVLVLVFAIICLISLTGGEGLKAQARVAMDTGDDGPVSFGAPPIRTGQCREPWPVHVPRGAHLGRHRMYHHPKSCSPNLNVPQAVAYDWMFSPPAEGDI